MSDTPAAPDRSFVTALARGFAVLRAFRPGETRLATHEIAARTGLPKPTVTRLTHTLCRLGYLVPAGPSGSYRLGAGVLALGYSALAGVEMADLAREELQALSAGPNPYVTAALGERHRLSVVYMAVKRSNQAVSLSMNVGARLPLFHSAIGRAVLMGMSGPERGHLLRLAIEERPEAETEIRRGLARAEEDHENYGFTTSFGEWRREVNGIAVPVEAVGGDRLYGLNVGGPSFLLPPEELIESYGERLRRTAGRLSRSGADPAPGDGLHPGQAPG